MQNIDELFVGVLFWGKIGPVGKTQRADQRFSMLAGDRAVLVAMPIGKTWLFHFVFHFPFSGVLVEALRHIEMVLKGWQGRRSPVPHAVYREPGWVLASGRLCIGERPTSVRRSSCFKSTIPAQKMPLTLQRC
jgi:hypothetical protein